MLEDTARKKTILCWSSGKDSAWALHVLRQQANVEVAGLLTTINEKYQRIAMHAVRVELLQCQANAVGLPLQIVPLPDKCSHAEYQAIMKECVEENRNREIQYMAFADMFLADIREYREKQLSGSDVTPLFPLWGTPTNQLASEMLSAGLRARITCVDPKKIPSHFAGSEFNQAFLDAIPESVDPCGENGEFHTFVFNGPMFDKSVPVSAGETVERNGFVFADLLLAEE